MVSVQRNPFGGLLWRQGGANRFSLHCAVTATAPRQAVWYGFCIFSGDVMGKLATAIAAIALIGTPAFAADIATKAPAPSPAPVYNWTGWYVGVNAGASFGNVKTDFNVAPVFAENPSIPGGQISPGFGASDRQYPSGFIGGGQIGYNWQYSPLIVVGLEADIQGALER